LGVAPTIGSDTPGRSLRRILLVMGGPDDRQDSAFLSLITRPEGVSDSDVARAILERIRAEAASLDFLDEPTLSLRFGLAPPLILGFVPIPIADLAVEVITGLGGAAFAPTIADIEALGPTLKIRELRVADGALDIEIWRGPTTRIAFGQIECLVRGHLSDTKVTTEQGTGWHSSVAGPRTMAMAPHQMRADYATPTRTSRTTTSDKLDVHTSAGDVFQIDGDKFGFAVLGEMRGYSDKANMDRLFELLQHVASEAIADDYFRLFKAPAKATLIQIPHARLNQDDPAFAFYSRWVALMYRFLRS
jgi:hypothetical protein